MYRVCARAGCTSIYSIVLCERNKHTFTITPQKTSCRYRLDSTTRYPSRLETALFQFLANQYHGILFFVVISRRHHVTHSDQFRRYCDHRARTLLPCATRHESPPWHRKVREFKEGSTITDSRKTVKTSFAKRHVFIRWNMPCQSGDTLKNCYSTIHLSNNYTLKGDSL